MEAKLELKFFHKDDYYGYCWYENRLFLLEGRNGEMLIGDKCPTTLEDTEQRLRCANSAHFNAMDMMQDKLREFTRDLRQ